MVPDAVASDLVKAFDQYCAPAEAVEGVELSGHVFHPGHEELHGITVVLDGVSGRTYVGRYHERTERGLLLHDVGVHDPAGGHDAGGVPQAHEQVRHPGRPQAPGRAARRGGRLVRLNEVVG